MEKKTDNINIRCTAEQHEIIRENAEKCDMTITEYILTIALTKGYFIK